MLKHLEALCGLCALSGDESAVRDYLIQALDGVSGVSWQIDPLGSLLVEKKGRSRTSHRLMISAHMDEVGLIVTYCNSDGTLCIAPVGGVDASAVMGRQVLVGAKRLPGVIGTKPVHLLSDEEKKTLPQFSGLTLDIGAESAEEASTYAPPGTPVYFLPGFCSLGGSRIRSKAIDDRIGCAILLELLEQESAYDFTAAFLVQEEIGLRGAGAAAYTVNPDFALVLEATTAADLAGAEGDAKVCVLGGGPVISYMDRCTIYDRELYRMAFDICQKHGIACQTKSRIAGGNDSGAIHVSRGGVRTLAVSLPCRYLHTPASVADRRDIEAMAALIPLLAEQITEEAG